MQGRSNAVTTFATGCEGPESAITFTTGHPVEWIAGPSKSLVPTGQPENRLQILELLRYLVCRQGLTGRLPGVGTKPEVEDSRLQIDVRRRLEAPPSPDGEGTSEVQRVDLERSGDMAGRLLQTFCGSRYSDHGSGRLARGGQWDDGRQPGDVPRHRARAVSRGRRGRCLERGFRGGGKNVFGMVSESTLRQGTCHVPRGVEGRAEGRTQGRARERKRWESWNRARIAAEEQGNSFTELPPAAADDHQTGERA